jgi:hypothetical protein
MVRRTPSQYYGQLRLVPLREKERSRIAALLLSVKYSLLIRTIRLDPVDLMTITPCPALIRSPDKERHGKSSAAKSRSKNAKRKVAPLSLSKNGVKIGFTDDATSLCFEA